MMIKFKTLSYLTAGILAIATISNVSSQPSPESFMPFKDFMKLPIPGAMQDFPAKANESYAPYVWSKMVTDHMLPFSKKAFEMNEDSEAFVWNMPVIHLIGQGNAANGKNLAKQHKCAKCHGDTGISDENDTPSIAGQARPYAFKQMAEYKNKIRDEKTMVKKMRKLTYKEIADLAAFYEIQKPEDSVIRNTSKKPPLLVTQGDKARYLIPCQDCHGRWGEGIGFESPAIAGQKAEHFIDTMTEFKEGDRTNDLYGRMRFITQQLSDEEIEQLAHYYASINSLKEEE